MQHVCGLERFHVHIYYRKRGSASYIVRQWLLWEVERERETPVTSLISRWNREWSCIIWLIPKTIGNWKRDCAWGCAWGINTTWEICRSKSTNQFGERNERLPDLCFSICRFSQVVFIPQAQPHAQSLFLFPIVFGINLMFATTFQNWGLLVLRWTVGP